MKKLVVGVVTIMVVIFLVVLFLITANMRYNLITIHPAFWLFSLGITFALLGGWLVALDIPGSKVFAGLGAVLLLLGAYKAIWPKTASATNHAQEVADLEAALAINNTVAPKPVRCDRESNTQYWDQVTRDPLVFYIINEATHRFECVDRKGFNPYTRQEYKEPTPDIVGEIRKQDPPPTPIPVIAVVPIPSPSPIVVVAPTPSPSPPMQYITEPQHIRPSPWRQSEGL